MSFGLMLKRTGPIEFLYSPELLHQEKVLVAFTLHKGGVSPPPYSSLNLGLHVGDNRENVVRNRRLLLSHLKLDIDRLTTTQQVHGNSAVVVEKDFIGRGAELYQDAIADTDALISSIDNVPLALFFADCVPIILVDPVKRCVAIAHAGWRGILSEITKNTISILNGRFDSKPEDLLAYIGPSIRECCYEVDEGLAEQFRDKFQLDSVGKTLDLVKLAAQQLKEAGMLANRIFATKYCTSCRSDMFYSYRRVQTTGRQAGLVALLDNDYEPTF